MSLSEKCIQRRRVYAREYYQSHREEILGKKKEYYQLKKEEIKQRQQIKK